MEYLKNYVEKVYGGWLGKVIGVRYGAPIEGWTYQKIKDIYGELNGYTRYYHDFGGDDDTNVPPFLIRAIEDCGTKLTPDDIGRTYLNYTPYGRPFFWLGGYGISTEHTALMNLRQGMEAKRAGSIAQNGYTIAEQIGGQIFIDPWGLIAPGSPELAARYAETAACVTHDGNGVYGGQFLACCISLAFVEKDPLEIIKKALTFIPKDCEYARVVNSVIEFYKKSPENWRDCYQYLFENFGYDRYGGSCHIIPNAGIMILSLLYGKGEFDRTMNIINMCGWDTDCNAGNIGTILGVLVGPEGIDEEKWVRPLEDQMICSSTIGYLNVQTISNHALYLAKLGCKVMGWEMPEPYKTAASNWETCNFELPYATHGLRVYTQQDAQALKGFDYRLINTDEDAFEGKRCLKIVANSPVDGQLLYVYKRTYLEPAEFSDPRYDPAISPIIYPGQTITAAVKIPEFAELGMRAQLYIKDRNSGKYYKSDPVEIESGVWKTLSWQIPALDSACISEAGVCFVCHGHRKIGGTATILLDSMEFTGNANYQVDFRKERMEKWSKFHKEVSQFAWTDGLWYLDENGDMVGSCYDTGFNSTGNYYWKDVDTEITMVPSMGTQQYFAFRVQGAVCYYATGFEENNTFVLRKVFGHQSEILASVPLAWEYGKSYRIKVSAQENNFQIFVDNTEMIQCKDEHSPYLSGCIGMSVKNTSKCIYRDLKVTTK